MKEFNEQVALNKLYIEKAGLCNLLGSVIEALDPEDGANTRYAIDVLNLVQDRLDIDYSEFSTPINILNNLEELIADLDILGEYGGGVK